MQSRAWKRRPGILNVIILKYERERKQFTWNSSRQAAAGPGEPSLTEEVQAQPESANPAGTEMPALNRADRRAQAKGKKTGTGAASNLNAMPAGHAAQASRPPAMPVRSGSRAPVINKQLSRFADIVFRSRGATFIQE